MRDMILSVDVDLTVVKSFGFWTEWYKDLTGHDLTEDLNLKDANNYEELMHKHHDPMEFWRLPDLYDNMPPMGDAVEALDILSKRGVQIVFCSACQPEHEKSKRLFLQRNFKFPFKFVSTSDKDTIRCDYFVDDYVKYCRDVKKTGAKVYQIKTEVNSAHIDEFPYMNWDEIAEDIIKDMNV